MSPTISSCTSCAQEYAREPARGFPGGDAGDYEDRTHPTRTTDQFITASLATHWCARAVQVV